LNPDYDEDASPVEVVPLQLPSQLACDQESDDEEGDVSSSLEKQFHMKSALIFIFIFI
jgi:hypothetical protein